MGSVPFSRTYAETDMEAQIHLLEQEAYSSVLRAFKAQADAITWEKESLITELRKELRLTNEEHRELLGRVNADDTIRRIREWRQAGGHQHGIPATAQAIHEPIPPSPTVSASRKKQKIGQPVPSQSFGGPSQSFHPQAVSTSHQPSSSAAKRGGSMSGSKGKKQKSGLPGGSAVKSMQYPPTGRGPGAKRVAGSVAFASDAPEGAAFNPFIGKRVRTRWPDDNSFYEAVITDFNPVEGRHALVYDMGTANETWEWVNLTEKFLHTGTSGQHCRKFQISPEDIQWVDEDPGVSHRGGFGGPGHGMNRPVGRDNAPGSGRGRGSAKGQPKRDFLPPQNGIGKKVPDDIRILHTESLIKEVERVFGASHPDPLEIEKAKKVLKDHEKSLIDAIARITEISDDLILDPNHMIGGWLSYFLHTTYGMDEKQ
ncbi:hypothetical protein ACFE04_002353 [Oxalis oulophora]